MLSGDADTEVDEGEDGGDELENSDSLDSEIEEEDKWQCEVCTERNHPITRRCRRCWTVRHDWFPSTLDRYVVKLCYQESSRREHVSPHSTLPTHNLHNILLNFI